MAPPSSQDESYNVYNYGAALQAYALQQYLLDRGHDTELLNYQPEYLTRKYNYKWVNPESKMSRYMATRFIYRILKFLQRQTTLKRKKAFDVFIKDRLKQTSIYTNSEQVRNNPPNADAYIVGSDQIWNTFYETGRDGVFYLDFVKKARKISYAASFSYVEIEEQLKPQLKTWLSDFNAISVREFHGIDILKELGLDGTWVLDPVFMLKEEKWKQIMSPFIKEEKYLLVYDFEGNDEIKSFAKKYANHFGLKIYSINDTYPRLYADRNFSSAGPSEFLSLIYYCEAFVSNSFHGTAFSIIFNKPVFVFNRHRHKVNSRMESLMTLFELKDCILEKGYDFESAINRKWNFERINRTKEKTIAGSIEFLNNSL